MRKALKGKSTPKKDKTPAQPGPGEQKAKEPYNKPDEDVGQKVNVEIEKIKFFDCTKSKSADSRTD